MNEKLDRLLGQMRDLEQEIVEELQKKEREFFYTVKEKKIHFTEEAKARHRNLVKRLHRYVLDSRFLIILTTPVIWSCIIPIALMDLIGTIYMHICFPIYGIPKVKRGDYILFDRRRLSYLNTAEKFNCEYCAYANGVLAYATEMAGRTEQYWCPIKHALRMKTAHSRYRHFFDYGDAEGYRQRIEKVRRAFEDIEPKSKADEPT